MISGLLGLSRAQISDVAFEAEVSAETQQALKERVDQIIGAPVDEQMLLIEIPPVNIPRLNKVEDAFRNQFRAKKAVESQS